MKIIISPAKQMRQDTDTLPAKGLPDFIREAGILRDFINGLGLEGQKRLWACNDKIAEENHLRFRDMDLEKALTPAILSYDGIQYKYMAPAVFEEAQLGYIEEHLRILSGFYGVLRPMDGVVPYRLEMQAKSGPEGFKDLYDFWGDRIYSFVMDESRLLIDLASKEYSKCIEKYLGPEDRCISCVFAELSGGRLVQKGVYAKMARGEMVRFMAERAIESPEGLKDFSLSGYSFDEKRSTDRQFVFIR